MVPGVQREAFPVDKNGVMHTEIQFPNVTFETIRKAALALPDVEEGTAWSFPAFRTGGKMFLCFREDLDSIVIVPVSFEQRDAMIEEDPATFYTTDHHRNYPCVLARIKKLRPSVVPGLLQMVWNAIPKKKPRRKRL
jgi:hypothetical protein